MDDLGFVPDQAPPSGGIGSNTEVASGGVPRGTGASDLGSDLGFVPDQQPESTTEQIKAGAEGLAQGIAGPAATFAETKLLGVQPQDIIRRQEQYPWTHGISEAVGFGGSALTGTGEAALLGKAGELAAHATGLGEAANTAQKLARGAVTAATEMGLYQAGDEMSKALLNAPQTPGSIVSNIGLSALLGGALGPAFAGAGIIFKKAIDSTVLKEASDELASLKAAGVDPAERARDEAQGAIDAYNNSNSELWGANGLRSTEIKRLLPEMNDTIKNATSDLAGKLYSDVQQMAQNPDVYPTRLAKQYESQVSRIIDSVTNPNATSSDIFDAINDTKRWAQSSTKDMWKYKSFDPEYEFAQKVVGLSKTLKPFLENENVWGDAAKFQNKLNSAFAAAKGPMDVFMKKFMVNAGNGPEVSADKFNTYFRQGLKNITQTDRQKIVENLIDPLDKYFKTVDDIYQKAGIENPNPPVGMGALKASTETPSLGVRIARAWHEKMSAPVIGKTLGAGVGGALGSPIGHGFEGAWLGERILGNAFGNILKPVLEKYPNVDLGAFQKAYTVAKSIEKGEANLSKAASSVISGAKTFPSHIIPSALDLEKLDKRIKTASDDQASIINIPNKVGYYLPGHDTQIAKTAGDAVSYLNSQRPEPQKAMPLDRAPKPSIADQRAYQRTLSIAQQPLVVFKHIKDGTLLPQDVKTIQAIYPDYYQKMSEKLMEQVVKAQQDGHEFPYQIRQSMSLFLGKPLDSTLLPQNIASAQGVFLGQAMANQNQMQASAKPQRSGNKEKLSKLGDSYLTPNEASIQRRNQA